MKRTCKHSAYSWPCSETEVHCLSRWGGRLVVQPMWIASWCDSKSKGVYSDFVGFCCGWGWAFKSDNVVDMGKKKSETSLGFNLHLCGQKQVTVIRVLRTATYGWGTAIEFLLPRIWTSSVAQRIVTWVRNGRSIPCTSKYINIIRCTWTLQSIRG